MLYYKVWKRITEEPHERDADIIFSKQHGALRSHKTKNQRR